MDRHRVPEVETMGKVLAFPPPGVKGQSTAADVAKFVEARAIHQREQRVLRGVAAVWVVLALAVAAARVLPAVRHSERFGVETSLAFIVLVLAPLVHARGIVATVRSAVERLRGARRAQRDIRSECGNPAQRSDRSGRPLQ